MPAYQDQLKTAFFKRPLLVASAILLATASAISLSACSQGNSPKDRDHKLSEFCIGVAQHILDRNPETRTESLTVLMHEELNDKTRDKLENTHVIPDSPITVMRQKEEYKSLHKTNKVTVQAKAITEIEKDQVTYQITGTDATLVDGKVVDTKPVDGTIICQLTPDMDGFPRATDITGFDGNSKGKVGSSEAAPASRRRHRR